DLAIEEQLFDGSVALHAGVDHAVVNRPAPRVEPLLEEAAESLAAVDLHREDERIAEDDDPSLVRRLRADVAIVADALRVDRDLGIELGRHEPRARIRPEAVSDRRI